MTRLYRFPVRIPPDQSRYHAELPFPREGLQHWRQATALEQRQRERALTHERSGDCPAHRVHADWHRPLTDRKAERLHTLFAFIRRFIAVQGRTREIARGLSRFSNITPDLRDLERLGFIEITPRKKRGLRVLPIQAKNQDAAH